MVQMRMKPRGCGRLLDLKSWVPPGLMTWCGPPSTSPGTRSPCQCKVVPTSSAFSTVISTSSPRRRRMTGSKDGSRVAIGKRRLAPDECMLSGGGLQLYRISLFGGVDQRRDRPAAIEAHRIALRETNAGNAANKTARNDSGGPYGELASV